MTSLTITGAGGYLGSSVAAAAVGTGEREVRCVVRHATADLPGRVIQVRDLRREAATAIAGTDAVVHLAAPNEVVTAADPDRANADTVELSRAVAEACATGGVRRIVYVSTVHVYGAALGPGAVVDEDTRPVPGDVYAQARLASEETIARHARGCEVVVLRLTNAVGPPAHPSVERWTLVANDLCRQAARGGDLRLRSSGLQWRDFIALPEATRVILAAADGRIRSGTYNLGSGVPTTILDLAEQVADAASRLGLPRPAVIAGSGGPTGPSEAFHVSVDRLGGEGFRPRAEVARELEDTIAFCSVHPESMEVDV